MGQMTSERITQFSPCRKYRYTLWREWEQDYHLITEYSPSSKLNQYAMFIGLNPSTADETKDDPTIRKCIGFAKRWGYGALCMTNLFAFRATDPKVMKREENPVGQDNHHQLLKCASSAGIVVAAWGVNGRHMSMDISVKQWLYGGGIKLHCLRMTGSGFPEHPLYVPYDSEVLALT